MEDDDDSKASFGWLPAVLAKERPENGQAPQSRKIKTRSEAEKHERAIQYFKRHS